MYILKQIYYTYVQKKYVQICTYLLYRVLSNLAALSNLARRKLIFPSSQYIIIKIKKTILGETTWLPKCGHEIDYIFTQ